MSVNAWAEVPLGDESGAEMKPRGTAAEKKTGSKLTDLKTQYIRVKTTPEIMAVAESLRKGEQDAKLEGKPVQVDDKIGVMATEKNKKIEVFFVNIYQANDQSVDESTSDLTGLVFLEEPNILHSLEHRFKKQQIYTAIAGIILVLNPYQRLPIYTPQVMLSYRKDSSGKSQNRNPHVYGVCEDAYSALTMRLTLSGRSRPMNQSLVVCGESGSGKTENAKQIMKYLCNRRAGSDLSNAIEEQSAVETQIVDTNAILESFGNSQTLLNFNSSRFGKFVKMFFKTSNMINGSGGSADQLDRVLGASTETYLLEKSRVVLQSKGERNFHVFYELLMGADEEMKKACLVTGKAASDFKYTKEGAAANAKREKEANQNDSSNFKNLTKALVTLNFDASAIVHIFSIVSSVLHLGNTSFVEAKVGGNADACEIDKSSTSHLDAIGKLLGLDLAVVQEKLVTQRIQLPRETIKKRIKASDAIIQRDALAKALYENLFLWLVYEINHTLEQDDTLPWVGILDIFGFETFEVNSFEQFCINFANERLQQHFNQSILLAEQLEYSREGIFWKPINIPDGQDTIDVICRAWTGILPLLDSACKLATGTPDFFLGTILKENPKSNLVWKAPGKDGKLFQFTLSHYAGPVTYTVNEFLNKNRDRADPEFAEVFSKSKNSVLVKTFASAITPPSGDEPAAKKVGNSSSSIALTFQSQLQKLVATLQETQSYFIRCIKPNLQFSAQEYDRYHVRKQLQCGGIVQAVKMLKHGFPTRITFDELFNRFSALMPVSAERKNNFNRPHFCKAVISTVFALGKEDFQLGFTKIFFKSSVRSVLYSIMNYERPLTNDQSVKILAYLARIRWLRLKGGMKSDIMLWRYIRGVRARVVFQKMVRRAVMIQKTFLKRWKMIMKRRREKFVLTMQAGLKTILETKRVYNVVNAKAIAKKEAEEKALQERIRAEKARQEAERLRLIEEDRKRSELDAQRKKEQIAREQAELIQKEEERRREVELDLVRRRKEEETRLNELAKRKAAAEEREQKEKQRIEEESRKMLDAELERKRNEEEAKLQELTRKRLEKEDRERKEKQKVEEETRRKMEAEIAKRQLEEEEHAAELARKKMEIEENLRLERERMEEARRLQDEERKRADDERKRIQEENAKRDAEERAKLEEKRRVEEEKIRAKADREAEILKKKQSEKASLDNERQQLEYEIKMQEMELALARRQREIELEKLEEEAKRKQDENTDEIDLETRLKEEAERVKKYRGYRKSPIEVELTIWMESILESELPSVCLLDDLYDGVNLLKIVQKLYPAFSVPGDSSGSLIAAKSNFRKFTTALKAMGISEYRLFSFDDFKDAYMNPLDSLAREGIFECFKELMELGKARRRGGKSEGAAANATGDDAFREYGFVENEPQEEIRLPEPKEYEGPADVPDIGAFLDRAIEEDLMAGDVPVEDDGKSLQLENTALRRHNEALQAAIDAAQLTLTAAKFENMQIRDDIERASQFRKKGLSDERVAALKSKIQECKIQLRLFEKVHDALLNDIKQETAARLHFQMSVETQSGYSPGNEDFTLEPELSPTGANGRNRTSVASTTTREIRRQINGRTSSALSDISEETSPVRKPAPLERIIENHPTVVEKPVPAAGKMHPARSKSKPKGVGGGDTDVDCVVM